jgi:hypothetical protein
MRFVMGRIGARAPYFLHYSTIVRAIDVFVDELRLGDLDFDGVQPHATGRPGASIYLVMRALRVTAFDRGRFQFVATISELVLETVTPL